MTLQPRAALLPLTFALLVSSASSQAQTATEAKLYQNPRAPLEARVADLMNRLTEAEKISLLSGTGFTTQPIARLGVPAMGMVDAGQGVRGGSDTTQGPATAFPSGVAMAATWNPLLVGRVARQIGIEAQNKGSGAQVLLGPAVNIQRSPLGGRNGEYFSEDPFLSARLAVAYIRAMQSSGTVACLKHFAANNEEIDRDFVDVRVGERALREIYLPSFEAGVKEGGAWSVMSSYNRVNGPHASASSYLLNDVLKRGWNFDGLVMSDWGGVHETARTINAGNDLEMPAPGFLSPAQVNAALDQNLVAPAQIEANATRIVRTILRAGLFDGPKTPDPALVNSDASREVALQTALEAMVLLKNQRQILPLDPQKLRSVALIGPAARDFQVGALGSPEVKPLRAVGPLEGLQLRLGAGVAVRAESGDRAGTADATGLVTAPNAAPNAAQFGFKAEYFANQNLEGAPVLTRQEAQIDLKSAPAPLPHDHWSARWNGVLTPRRSGEMRFFLRADDGCRLFLDDKPLIDHWQDGAASTQTASVTLEANRAYRLRADFYQNGGDALAKLSWLEAGAQPYAAAIALARSSDVAVVLASTQGTEGEGNDRPAFGLPGGQDELIRAVAAANPRTIVVLNSGTPVAMPWLSSVPGVLEAWFPGQEGGRALAQILCGDVSPSGHLPTTFAARREDYPDFPNFPGTKGRVNYDEGIYVGYRAFDKRGVAPLFPFGFGLSYTTFRIDDLKLSTPQLAANGRLTVTARVTNTGKRAGSQVVQLYVRDPKPAVDKAPRELKGFAKVALQPGQSQNVTLILTPRDFAWCDVKSKGWRATGGSYFVEIGDSSRHLTAQKEVQVAPFFESVPLMRADITPDSPDLALGARAFASSTQKETGKAETVAPGNATDGDERTRWGSEFLDDQWLALDLDKPQRIGRVRLVWEAAFARDYRLEVSDDGQNYRPVYSSNQGQGGEEEIEFAPTTARFVRLFSLHRATQYGTSLLSFEVRAPRNSG